MKVDVFTLCDFAQALPGNKMTVVGTFNTIWAKQTPVVHALCALAVLMRFEQIEQGTKNIRVSIIDSDGRQVMPTLNAQLNIQITSESDATVPLALVIQQIKLPNFGEYSVDLAVDNRQEASIPLYVKQAPQAQQQPPHPQ